MSYGLSRRRCEPESLELIPEIEDCPPMRNLTRAQGFAGHCRAQQGPPIARAPARRGFRRLFEVLGGLAVPFATKAFETNDRGRHIPPPPPSSRGSVTDQ